MHPYESGAAIDMNMGHNSATPATTGADALRVAAQAALTALENLHEIDTETECITIDVRDEIDALRAALASAAQPEPAPAAQVDALPREDFAWMVVQEACETEPADEDDPECIRILRRDLKSAVLAAFLREDAARMDKEGDQHG